MSVAGISTFFAPLSADTCRYSAKLSEPMIEPPILIEPITAICGCNGRSVIDDTIDNKIANSSPFILPIPFKSVAFK